MTLPAAPRPASAGPAADPVGVVRRAPVGVRPADPDDLEVTAAIHHRCLPDGFFARLGSGFLARYHDSFRTSSSAVLLVAEHDGEVVGFLAGTSDNAAHYRRLVRSRPVGLVVSGVGALLRDLSLAAEFVRTRTGRYTRALLRQLRTRRGPAGDDAAAPTGDPRPVAVLTHVAVIDRARGTGAGRALVEAFLAHLAATDVDEVRLVTAVAGDAPSFYRRLGWRSAGVRRAADGTDVEEFVRTV